MSVVYHALQTLSRQLNRTLLPAAALICCLALLGGCGSSRHSTTKARTGSSGVGESIRLDNCSDWNRATLVERRTTVAQLRRFAGGPIGSSSGRQSGPVLDDERAYKLFQSYCAKPFARGFKLYKLYTRAAAFIGQ